MEENERVVEQRLTKLETCVALLTEMFKEMKEEDKNQKRHQAQRTESLVIGILTGIGVTTLTGIGMLIINYFK